ncbi:HEAT repeat domain-containing protein [Salinimonas sediminis]|uniref:HEAT repeat domain-containing protein n=1 Tax=Salinimonas sediminis TaxID=2303538 RepID=A0A346NRS2_9ALTE|nr:HEAT repeat domain-containing protein [Salinimonas sediminis]AXR08229.1 HEAT repeat domain-containing protein [Salinimonas sediminis]
MKKNEQIEQFFRHHAARKSSQERVESIRTRNGRLPIVAALNKAFDGAVAPEPETLKTLLATHSTDTLAYLTTTTIEHMSEDSFYFLPMAGHSTYFAHRIIIKSTADYDLSLDFIDPALLKKYKAQSKANLQQRGITFFGRETLSYFIHAGDMTISKWTHPKAITDLQGMRCQLQEQQTLTDGDVVHCQNNQTFMFDNASSSAVIMTLEIKRAMLPVSLIFSAADHTLRFQNPSNEADSRIQLCMAILTKLDYVKAIPTLKTFLDHPQHFIRWYAMQQILALDALEALSELADMATRDPHQEVRQAAKETLLMIQQQGYEHAC